MAIVKGNSTHRYISKDIYFIRQFHPSLPWEQHVQPIQTLRVMFSGSTLGRYMSRRAKQFSLRYKICRIRATGNTIRIVVGAGPRRFVGWVSTDLPVFNALMPSDWLLAIPRASISRMLLEHVIEHWKEMDFRLFLRLAKPVFVGSGFMRLAVPDGFHPDPSYIKSVKPGGKGCGADDHKVLYNYKTLAQVLSDENYAFRFVEYFDEKECFHSLDWEPEDGYVERSAANDPRNKMKPLCFTSLIIDAWPEKNSIFQPFIADSLTD